MQLQPRSDVMQLQHRSEGMQLHHRALTTVVRASSSLLSAQPTQPPSPLGFGFSAGGLLFPYYIGVIMALRDELCLLTDDTPVAGASAGSLVAATAKSGISEEDLVEATLQLSYDCRTNGTRFRLRSVLERTLEKVLPDDIHERCSGNVHLAVTHVWPQLRPQLISQFETRRELIDTLLVSCHIPWYMDGTLATGFGDGFAFDGGLTDFIPTPPDCSEAIRVTCFPSRDLRMFGGIGISPDAFEEWPYTIRQMVSWALEPAPEDVLLSLIDKGKRDTRMWAASNGYASPAGEQEQELVFVTDGASQRSQGIYLPSDGASRGSGIYLPSDN